ncbi:galactose-3-O-sulfotransferase 2-like [Rhinophrynus dorsalis]
MNMLFRFGESYNLTFAFPAKDNTQFFYPGVFHSSYVEGYLKKGYESFDIMCHHMRFQLSEVEKVMPKDTFYFTIMRNPVSQMESSFSYYKKQDIFSKAESLEEFLKNTSSYYLSNSHSSNYAKNLMTFDLGFDHNGLESIKHFQLNWRAVETMFNLVLITEYFDESLVLLKDALCWSLDDVLSFPLNSRSDTTKKSLSHDTQERIKSWNQLDWQLYLYFNSSFWNRVEKFGRDRMQHEVEELRQRRSQMVETCIQGEVDPDKIQDKSLKPYQSGEARILGYNIKPGLDKGNQLLCQRLVTPELQYSKLLLKRQRQLKDNALYREKETINKSK